MAQSSQVYNLTFHQDHFNKPILFDMGKRFRLTVNIRRAILNEEAGWAEVQLSGAEEEIGRAIADLHTTGVNVSGPITDLVDPDYDQYLAPGIGRGT
jgi:ABC-type methionine transport system ATPase subunit